MAATGSCCEGKTENRPKLAPQALKLRFKVPETSRLLGAFYLSTFKAQQTCLR